MTKRTLFLWLAVILAGFVGAGNRVANLGTSGTSPGFIVSTSAAGGDPGGTTAAVDTTGANLIVINISLYQGASGITVSDSKSNTWTALTNPTVGGQAKARLYYCYSPTVGSGHTFSVAGTNAFGGLQVVAFSGAAASPFDVENNNNADSPATLTPGSVTPSQASSIVVTGLAWNGNSGTIAIGDSYTVAEQNAWVDAVREGGAIAYKVLAASSAQNPAWDGASTPTDGSAVIAVFKGQ